MTEVVISGPRGTLMVEIRGADVLEAEKVAFPSVPGVPKGKVYVGPHFNHYRGGNGPDPRGSFHDITALGRITPGHHANRVVVHGARHTDWRQGESVVSDPGEGILRVNTSTRPIKQDAVRWSWRSVGTVHATHSEHAGENFFAFDDLGAAADSL